MFSHEDVFSVIHLVFLSLKCFLFVDTFIRVPTDARMSVAGRVSTFGFCCAVFDFFLHFQLIFLLFVILRDSISAHFEVLDAIFMFARDALDD